MTRPVFLLRLLLAVLLVLPLHTPAKAQDLAALIADEMRIEADSRLIAQGNVEVLFQGTRLQASRIVYDSANDIVRIEGPIILHQGKDTILLADSAALSTDLQRGILQSARLVLDQQIQLAAAEITRIDGRYTQLSRTVASSCEVCPARPTPLWEIRARRVIHDQQEQQLYFDRAQFRVMGVPLAYIPRLRMPDPTLDRANGFLVPSIRTTTDLGTGITVPYFIKLGDHRDLTFSPYLSTKGAHTLATRYRQAFRTGEVELNANVSRDNLRKSETRYHLQGEGRFDLPRDFELTFDLQSVSDPAYLWDYNISDVDRLDSIIAVRRTRLNDQFDAEGFYYHTLREDEGISTLPTQLNDLRYNRRIAPLVLGGRMGVTFETHTHYRSSTIATDENDDGEIDGRDLGRITALADWRRDWTLHNGILFATQAELAADFYRISDDETFPATLTRATPTLAAEMRWPWIKAGGNGISHVLEPIAQIVWTPKTADGNIPPNEDSPLVEFDEGNLFALNRFPGADAREQGLRANIGANWTRYDPSGWGMGLTMGRVFRADETDQFTPSSGLSGTHSDWLAALRLTAFDRLMLTDRMIFDDNLDILRNELRLAWDGATFDLATSLIWLQADPEEKRHVPTSEWSLDMAYDFSDRWHGSFEGRYDFEADRASRAGAGLVYRNECVTVDLSLSRRYASSTSVSPSTNIGLSVELAGFGNRERGPVRRSCAQ